MREILFRAKRYSGEWVYGYYVHQFGAHEIRSRDDDEYQHESYHIKSETVGQYTGLNDKNGNKIFEGDILSIFQKSDSVGRYFDPPIKYPANVIVKWDLCAWMWEVILQEKFYLSFPDAWCHYECEIIGNIYDNPELIGGDAQ